MRLLCLMCWSRPCIQRQVYAVFRGFRVVEGARLTIVTERITKRCAHARARTLRRTKKNYKSESNHREPMFSSTTPKEKTPKWG